MKAFVKGLIILIMMTVYYSCCNSQENTEDDTANTVDDVLVRYDLINNTNCGPYYSLLINLDTGVQYLILENFMTRAVTTLVDAEGKPILYGNSELTPNSSNRFFITKRTCKEPFDNRNNAYNVVVDRVTKVQYILLYGLALLSDAEGKPRLYQDPIPPL